MKKPRYCPNIKSVIASDELVIGRVTLARMRCRKWSCPVCGPKNAQQWRAFLLDTFTKRMRDKRWVFVTLTAHQNAHISPEMSLKNLKQVWDKLYDRLRYKTGRALSWVMVYERHKSGRFHLHMLVDLGEEYDAYHFLISPDLDRAAKIKREKRHPLCIWLKEMSIKNGGGKIVHMTRIKEGDTSLDNVRLAVGYVTKYFTKAVEFPDFPERMRRIGSSRDIGSPRTKGKSGFKWYVKRYIALGEIERIEHYSLDKNGPLERADFDEWGFYPPEHEE